jgi:hypothetical protein
MKRTVRNSPNPSTIAATLPNAKSNNGQAGGVSDPSAVDLSAILASLQSVRDGDFSVRLPGSWIGLAGKVADTFNHIVSANQQMAKELKRVGEAVGKKGRTRERIKFHESRGAWGEMEVSVNTCCGPPMKLLARLPQSPRAT